MTTHPYHIGLMMCYIAFLNDNMSLYSGPEGQKNAVFMYFLEIKLSQNQPYEKLTDLFTIESSIVISI